MARLLRMASIVTQTHRLKPALRSLARESRKVQVLYISGLVRPQVSLFVRPALTPAAQHQHKRAFWYPTVLFLPGFEVGHYGIAVPSGKTQLREALRDALRAVIADGSYDQVLSKWNVSAGALKTAAINGGS